MKNLQYKSKIGNPDHGFGFVRDPGVHGQNGFYNPFRKHPASLLQAAALPDYTTNVRFAPPVWNQWTTGSCVGHGIAGMVTTTVAAHGQPLQSPESPRFTYLLGRIVDRSDPSIKLKDQGAAPNSAVRAIAHWGVVLEHEVDGGRTAASPDYGTFLAAHVNDEPKLGELEKAGRRIISGFSAIEDDDSAKVAKFRQALASRHCVGVAVDAGADAFQDYDEDKGPMGFTGAEPDHWIFCLDYATVAALQAQGQYPANWPALPAADVLFLFQNSWGTGSWTRTGRFWATADFVARGCFNSIVANLGV